jgi:PAS domain S-box-containing protein
MANDRSPLARDAPDPDATGAPEAHAPGTQGAPGRETREREAAFRRGELRARDPAAAPGPHKRRAAEHIAQKAFASLAENVRDFAVFLLDPDGVITFWGEGARLMKWWTKEQAEGAHLRLLYPDGGSEDGTAEAHLREAVETGEYAGEGHRVRSDGTTFWTGVSLTALRDPGGELLGFAKVTRDLTARRTADAVLRAARDEAEEARAQADEANRAKSLFLATMSHEIRTPINAVMGYVDLLEAELAGPLAPRQREYLARVRASNAHLLGIIDEVLDFSHLEAERVALAVQGGRLATPVDAALQMVKPQARAKGVELSDAVSRLAADVPYRGDEDRVRQVLVVLLSNAVKFTPWGGRITVSAGTAQQAPSDTGLSGPGPWVYVRVEDTGPGIPAESQAAIFEPFQQADMALTRRHGGTGLGLAIARRLAALMGGDLAVRSQPGAGSTFFLWLPGAAEEALESALSRGEHVDPPGPRLLQEVHDALLAELERILHAYIARLRSDRRTPSADTLSEAELEDHLATFLSDLAATFGGMDPAGGTGESVRDGTAIQRRVAERHGSQRRRLGWSEAEIRREFEILREEVVAAVRRRVHGRRASDLDPVLVAVADFISTAERVSLSTFQAS